LPAVSIDLLAQSPEPVELRFASDSSHEANAHSFPIEVCVKAEQVHLDRVSRLERRPIAEVGNTVK
jgi:hypothetical protein